MARYQVLYWKDIPAQVRAQDDFDEVRLELAPEFMARIDRTAQAEGLTEAGAYLEHWAWSEEQERPGDADEVAAAVKRELEAEHGG